MPVTGSMVSLLVSRLTLAPWCPCGTETAPLRIDGSTLRDPGELAVGAADDHRLAVGHVGGGGVMRMHHHLGRLAEVVELGVQVADLPARHEHERVRVIERGQLVDEQPGREPPATQPRDVLVDPWRGQVVVDLDPAVGDELLERSTTPLRDLRQHDVVGQLLVARVRQVVPESAAELGEHPPRRATVAHRVDDRRGVLRRDSRAQEVPEGHVGALELVLRGQHVGRDRRRVVGDDLDGGEHVELAQRRLERVGVGKRGEQMSAEVEHGADVAGADLVGEHRAGPLAEEGVRVRSAARARPERTVGR